MNDAKIIDYLLGFGAVLVTVILTLIGVNWKRHEKEEDRRQDERKEDVTELFNQTRTLAERVTKLESRMATKEDIFGLYNEIRKHVDISHGEISTKVETCSQAISHRIDGLMSALANGKHKE
jgi:uncharacterized protein YlxW (UPF0749 family)